ncbi:unnamed protein product [Dimorphilus gyrociliatus]|uniref:Uncharacterized protein n=1 Tax=Dimorphilus gyrociliatus TaxID=2664684 RepID=A0A7I8VS41_9ANNE|nr:unnamed protein product [Dimorphilus gyrociliatus]
MDYCGNLTKVSNSENVGKAKKYLDEELLNISKKDFNIHSKEYNKLTEELYEMLYGLYNYNKKDNPHWECFDAIYSALNTMADEISGYSKKHEKLKNIGKYEKTVISFSYLLSQYLKHIKFS